jgi:UDP-N-acetyl-D-glucosamine dehydrogenase
VSERTVVCIQGLGFVGAAMAVAVASARDERGQPRFSVVGIDLPTASGEHRIAELNRGMFPFRTADAQLVQSAAAAHAAGNLRASSDPRHFGHAEVILVDVHLDVDAMDTTPAVDFRAFRSAIGTIARHMKPGTLVIVETTVPPGTCERVVAPEIASGLLERGLPADAFLLAHSYERVMPGSDYLVSITNFWRVYAGHTPAAADACEKFLSRVINVKEYPLTRLGSTTASEIAKVMENSYRATNIAFIEEWARLAEVAGVDLFEVIDAIRKRPTHSNLRQPGFGVGGYCLTKDPLFPGIAARTLFERPDLSFPFSELAVQTNQRMPLVSIDRLRRLLGGSLRGKRVLLMGAAYKQDVADTRYSPSQIFVEEARREGAEVRVHDPLVTEWPELGLAVSDELPPASTVDAVVFAVPHRQYIGLDLGRWLDGCKPVVLDANAVLTPEQWRSVNAAGCVSAAIGRG